MLFTACWRKVSTHGHGALVCASLTIPRWLQQSGIKVSTATSLYPTWALLNRFKRKEIDTIGYTHEYYRLLLSRFAQVQQWVDAIPVETHQTIFCHEDRTRLGDEFFCHRELAFWLAVYLRPEVKGALDVVMPYRDDRLELPESLLPILEEYFPQAIFA